MSASATHRPGRPSGWPQRSTARRANGWISSRPAGDWLRPTHAGRTTGRSSGGRSRPSTPTWQVACGWPPSARSSTTSCRSRRRTRRSSTRVELAFGPPILRPASLRDFYAFERHVATVWGLRGGEVPEAWYRLPVFYFSNVSEIRGPGEPVWAPRGSAELDFELEVCALIDTPARDLTAERGAEAIGGVRRSSTTGRRATSSATRRPSGSGRPRARTSPARSDRGS